MKNTYLKLFLSTFKISACTFGGGFVIIPLLKKKYVEELGWIEEQEMLDLTAIAQASPGAIAVNASFLVGYHIKGIKGALINVAASVLPPLIIISIISKFYQMFRDNTIVTLAMAGMLAGVAAVICDVVISMITDVVKRKNIIGLLVLICSFLSTHFFNVNILLIILISGIIGALQVFISTKKEGEFR